MKALIILAILVAGGWYGWQWYTGDAAMTTTDTQSASVAHPPSALPGPTDTSDNDVDDITMGPAEGSAEAADGGLPSALAAQLEEADALWDQQVATGANPAIGEHVLTLARLYAPILKATYNKPQLKELQLRLVHERLSPLAETMFFSSRPLVEDPEGFFFKHTIKTGEHLDNLGREYGLSYEMINLMRGADPQSGNYRAGQVLKLFDAKEKGYELHIDKSDFYLDAYIGDLFAKRFPVGHGAPATPTPVGTTYIESREKYPQWTDPKTGNVYNFGEDGHILGAVWMRFNNRIGKSGLGIHGYTGEDGRASGTMESNGCVRMENDDALMLFNIMVKCQFSSSGEFITRAPMVVEVVE